MDLRKQQNLNNGERYAANEQGMNCRKIAENEQIAIFRTIPSIITLRIAFLLVSLVALSGTALAQCGASFNSMALAAASVRSQAQVSQSSLRPSAAASNNAVNTSIVGLWHIRFLVGDAEIQDAFQIWNTGGTEVHNPNVDPRQGNVCLGTWNEAAPQTFKLNHRVWLYTADGTFLGVGHLHETLTLGDRGSTQSGSFTLDLYDLSGNKLAELAAGTVTGERISVSEP